MKASELMDRARRIVLDETNVRWPLAELGMWLNDAQRETILQKPSASSDNRVLSLQSGTYQALPVDALTLLRITRNVSGTAQARVGGRAIRVVSRDVLDSQHPDWHSTAAIPFSPVVKHYIYDESDTKSFYVFPGNDGTGKVEAVVSKIPTVITHSGGDPETLTNWGGDIGLPDIYSNVILDYMLFRAYSKDAQYAGNSARAAAHYQQFGNSLGIKLNVEALLSPNQGPGIKAVQSGAP